MPITFSDGTVYKDEFNYVSGQPEPKETEKDLSSAPVTSPEDQSQNASQIDSKPRTEDWTMKAGQVVDQVMGKIKPDVIMRDMAIQTVKDIAEAGPVIGKMLDGTIDHKDPEAIKAVTTMASNLGLGGITTSGTRPNTVGVFGGPGARQSARPAGVERAEVVQRLEKAGVDQPLIENLTGWFKDSRDGKWKFELSDAKAKLDNEVLDSMKLVAQTSKTGGAQIPLKDFLDHPDVYRLYPELKDVTVVYSKKQKGVASYSDDAKVIGIGDRFLALSDKEKTAKILHEIQHNIQYKEGFATGGAPDYARMKELESMAEVLTDRYRLLKDKEQKGTLTKTEKIELDVVSHEKIKGLLDEAAKQKSEDFQRYQSIPGEIESRNVEHRYYMDTLGVKKPHPRKSETNVPEQILHDSLPVMKPPREGVPRGWE